MLPRIKRYFITKIGKTESRRCNMKNQQTILCDVDVCKYHDNAQCCCKLSQITVTPCDDCETAHYCKDYIHK